MRVYCLVIFASVLFYALTVTGLCDRILATQKGAATTIPRLLDSSLCFAGEVAQMYTAGMWRRQQNKRSILAINSKKTKKASSFFFVCRGNEHDKERTRTKKMIRLFLSTPQGDKNKLRITSQNGGSTYLRSLSDLLAATPSAILIHPASVIFLFNAKLQNKGRTGIKKMIRILLETKINYTQHVPKWGKHLLEILERRVSQ